MVGGDDDRTIDGYVSKAFDFRPKKDHQKRCKECAQECIGNIHVGLLPDLGFRLGDQFSRNTFNMTLWESDAYPK